MQLRQLARRAGIGDDDVLWVKSLGGREDDPRAQEMFYDNDYGIEKFDWPDVLLEEIE